MPVDEASIDSASPSENCKCSCPPLSVSIRFWISAIPMDSSCCRRHGGVSAAWLHRRSSRRSEDARSTVRPGCQKRHAARTNLCEGWLLELSEREVRRAEQRFFLPKGMELVILANSPLCKPDTGFMGQVLDAIEANIESVLLRAILTRRQRAGTAGRDPAHDEARTIGRSCRTPSDHRITPRPMPACGTRRRSARVRPRRLVCRATSCGAWWRPWSSPSLPVRPLLTP